MALRLDYLPLAAIALMLLASIGAYPFMPDSVAIHWNLYFQPDGYGGKTFAVLILPVVGLGLIAMQLIGRAIAHDGRAPLQFSKAIIFAMPILAVAHLAIIVVALTSRPG